MVGESEGATEQKNGTNRAKTNHQNNKVNKNWGHSRLFDFVRLFAFVCMCVWGQVQIRIPLSIIKYLLMILPTDQATKPTHFFHFRYIHIHTQLELNKYSGNSTPIRSGDM